MLQAEAERDGQPQAKFVTENVINQGVQYDQGYLTGWPITYVLSQFNRYTVLGVIPFPFSTVLSVKVQFKTLRGVLDDKLAREIRTFL